MDVEVVHLLKGDSAENLAHYLLMQINEGNATK
jgi:hypothetical protein